MPLLKLTPYARCTEAVLVAVSTESSTWPTVLNWRIWRHRALLSKRTKYIAHHISQGNRYLAGEAYRTMWAL